jgi:hypothetical protein
MMPVSDVSVPPDPNARSSTLVAEFGSFRVRGMFAAYLPSVKFENPIDPQGDPQNYCAAAVRSEESASIITVNPQSDDEKSRTMTTNVAQRQKSQGR